MRCHPLSKPFWKQKRICHIYASVLEGRQAGNPVGKQACEHITEMQAGIQESLDEPSHQKGSTRRMSLSWHHDGISINDRLGGVGKCA